MNKITTKTQTRRLLKGALVAAVAIVMAAGAPARAQTEITLIGQDNPAVDLPAVQSAVDTYDIVKLEGTFDFTGVGQSLAITRDVVLVGQDDAAGNMARIIANNGVEVAVWINNPGGTVELDNLDIESTSGRIVHVGLGIWWPSPDGCKDLKVKNCRIVSTLPEAEAACIGTFGGVKGAVYLEGNYISGHYCAGDWGWWVGSVGNCTWDVCCNTLLATSLCLDPIASKGMRIENNHCEGPSILHAPATQGEIVITDNTMLQSGHQVFGGANNAFGMYLSHESGFSGGRISGNTITMSPSENVPLSGIVPAICLGIYPAPAHGMLVEGNTITGKADWGIALDSGSSDNIIKANNLENFTAVQFGQYGAAQILIGGGGHDNLLSGNVIGPLGPGAGAGILCWVGYDNDLIRNHYTSSGIQGLSGSNLACVLMGPATGGNLVHEPGRFPRGTGGATEQVLDLPRELTGSTTNRVAGHSASTLAEDINPGIGQRVKDALDQLE